MLHVFSGEDTFRSRAAYVTAREQARQEHSLEVLRGDTLTIERLSTALSGQSLFRQSQAVAVEDLTTATGDQADRIVVLLQHQPPETLLLVWESTMPQERSKVWKALKEYADTSDLFPSLSAGAQMTWIEEQVRLQGGVIVRSATQALVQLCGTDTWKLASELQKLLLYAHGRPITVEDVECVAIPVTDANIFLTVRALASGDGREALRQIARHRALGEDPRRVLSLTVREARLLLLIRDLLDRKQVPTPWSLAKDLHLPVRAADALLMTARTTTMGAARALFDRLILGLYALNTGRADPDDLLHHVAFHALETNERPSPRR